MKRLVLMLLLLLAAATALAQKPDDGYEAYKPPPAEAERVAATPLVISAYVTFWGLTLLYVMFLARKQAQLQAEVRALEQRLGASPPP